MEVDLFKKGASKTCVFGDCKTDSRYSDTPFISFPKPCLAVRKGLHSPDTKHLKECVLCHKSSVWVSKCRRKDKFTNLTHVKKWHYICVQHFVNNTGPTTDNPYPLTASEASHKRNLQLRIARKTRSRPMVSPVNIKKQKTEQCDKHKTEESESKHSDANDHNIQEQNSQMDGNLDIQSSGKKEIGQVMEHACEDLTNDSCIPGSSILCGETIIDATLPVLPEQQSHQNCSTQTTWKWKSIQLLEEQNRRLIQENNNLKKEVMQLKEKLRRETKYVAGETVPKFVESLKKDDKKCKFYTSLTFKDILSLLTFLSPLDNLHYWGTSHPATTVTCKRKLSHLEELIIMLVRLRAGLLVEDMKYRFNMSTAFITKIVTTWVQHCYAKFDVLRPLMLATRVKVKKHLPPIFKRLKNIRIIIDCAEFYCQSPSNFEQQSNVYSAYKATTTFKVLLGCTPNGAISFVSDLFEGSISDKEIVEKSKLIDFLDDGDLVLADRGFTISDMTNQKNVSLNIPPFLKGRDKLTAEEEYETKKIAKQRIYIEHIVGKVKQFRLLKHTLPLNMRGILSQIVFVCACLVNFQDVNLK